MLDKNYDILLVGGGIVGEEFIVEWEINRR
ncbi:MAG: hypothetical protein MHPDNHAH_02858 [Anaerolineales bacterium]|nr:hypothetical protein [Anaerolineales bacterium]